MSVKLAKEIDLYRNIVNVPGQITSAFGSHSRIGYIPNVMIQSNKGLHSVDIEVIESHHDFIIGLNMFDTLHIFIGPLYFQPTSLTS